ncbi:sensor histidine kinase [Amycolatopsis saalfeldensis]|uniref:histidine kinase n=1 Tax=Amycolatopsis saalfeldensis TaxID=394193 RepID=A0A1H8Y971_9PSEU|nr:histidine kinase [Amycolatopsis saalfeldensis]SEP48820.1 Signal transduction histidine kinase [Amycolatopsis saalfeldensis]
MPIFWQWQPGSLRADVDPGRGRGRSVRDVFVDATGILIAVVAGLLSALPSLLDGMAPADLADLALGGLGCAALLVRRRWPAALALVLAALSAVSLTVGGAAGVATFFAAVHRRLRAVVWVAGLGVATSVVNTFTRQSPEVPWWAGTTIGVLATAVLVGLGRLVRARRQLLVSLAERARLVEEEHAGRLVEARRLERTRLAREMHDVLAHRMSLLSVHAGALEFNPAASEAEISRAAGIIRSGAHQMLIDLREVIGLLREDPAGDSGLRAPALDRVPELVTEARQAGTAVRLEIPETAVLATISALVGCTAYRIVQEGLTNARKHAPGRPVTVALGGAAGSGLRVVVRQPLPSAGAGLPIPGAGTGLAGLTERAALAGGRLEHGPAGDEYLLRAWLPWEA